MRTLRRVLVYLGLGIAVIGATGVLAVVITVFWLTRDLPSIETLRDYTPPVTTRVYAGDGTLLGEYARERRIFVPIGFVPKLITEAFTSAEDKNFYNHPGIDPSGIMRAAVKDMFNVLQHKRLEGASTITQQVAKNFLLNSSQNFARKIKEAVLAIRIDATYSKQKILELYLNEIYLGENSYGVAAASLNYFGKSLDELDVAEVAFLAALPKAPSQFDPVRNHQAAVDRRNWVIGQMYENGYITKEQRDTAQAEPLITQTRAFGSQTQDADYFVEEVRRELYARYGEQALYDGGLQVRSTLDTALQNYAVNALRAGLVRYDRRHGWRGALSNIDINGNWKDTLKAVQNQSGVETWRVAVVLGFDGQTTRIGLNDGSEATIPWSEITWAHHQNKGSPWGGPPPQKPADVYKPGDVIYVEALPNGANEYGLRQVPEINGGIVAMDPHTGRVLALSGGFSYASSQFDRAFQAMRQTGSSFKPYVYAAALDNGYTPVSKVLDGPFEMNDGSGHIWRPKNFERGGYLGMATLRRGLELSRNLMTVRLAQAVGMDKVIEYPIKFGAYDHLQPLLANSLGAGETTLLKQVTGYAVFVNGGKRVIPSLIDRIQDRNGKTIWRHDGRNCDGCDQDDYHGQQEPLLEDVREQVLDPLTAYQMVHMMEGVVQFGTGRSVLAVGKPLAGKTGTSNEAKDVWFVGFSPDLLCGVYAGFDNPRGLGGNEQGASVSAPIFRDFMKGALSNTPGIPFRQPPGIEIVKIDHKSGAVGGTFPEAFKPNTAPGEPDAPNGELGGNSTTFGGSTTATDDSATAAPTVDPANGGLY
ncbi:MAG: penicillin-binding protein 1A [Alphaproteobacteria bacterium]|nr:penicillin-binding protein 1A [Alphaproteobacteria bacterium]MBL7096818.1 penicillin-binding protein 1A [Alphaproteobacteria bacterium]